MNCSVNKLQVAFVAIALLATGGISAKAATAPPMPSRIVTRSLSTQDIKDYALTGLQGASGLSTVGIGQPAYLECLTPLSMPATDVLSVNWSLTEKPLGSAATLQASPLGSNVPINSGAEDHIFRLSGRTMVRPDVEGIYVVSASIATPTNTITLTKKITGARFLGYQAGCIGCHSGDPAIQAPDMSSVTNTGHATALKRKLDDSTGHFGANCISCHALGYDLNTNAVNGGFDDIAKQAGWVFPSVLTNGNWAAMPEALKNVSNIQCENCHGPGSRHIVHNGILGNKETISVSMDSGNCGQCHDAKTHHIKNPEWKNSMHAIATPAPTGPSRVGCVECHTAKGFVAKSKGQTITTAETEYEPIGCATCHDPHNVNNPHQLRAGGEITLKDNKTLITNAGNAAICMNCHLARRDATNYVEVTSGGSSFGPHESPQTDMLVGANAITYNKQIGSSAHGRAVEEACVHCHMQEVAANQPGFTLVGGHTFKAATGEGASRIELVEACTECHGEIEDFNLKRQDYDGNGLVEGVQDEVKSLLRKLGKLLPPVGQDKDDITITSSWSKPQLKAAYNYRFVQKDGSFGIHNAAYAVGILKASIADLTGDGNDDGISDAWQIKYFGSANDPNAAPNATPANDGIPNWLKWSLDLNPTIPGVEVPGGIIWANASSMGGSTDKIQIFTAAEVVFNTEVGKTYQLEAISTLGGGWTSVGAPVAGTGSSYSMVTPTRSNTQQFFRVVATP